jgi:hypothetical protein
MSLLVKRTGFDTAIGLVTGTSYDHRTPFEAAEKLERKAQAELKRGYRGGGVGRWSYQLADSGTGFEPESSAERTNDQLRKDTAKIMAEAIEHQARPYQSAEISTFLMDHPAYRDDGAEGVRNGAIVASYLEAAGRIRPYGYEDLEWAYQALKAKGALKLNQKALDDEYIAQVKKRNDEAKQRELSQEDYDGMSSAELFSLRTKLG